MFPILILSSKSYSPIPSLGSYFIPIFTLYLLFSSFVCPFFLYSFLLSLSLPFLYLPSLSLPALFFLSPLSSFCSYLPYSSSPIPIQAPIQVANTFFPIPIHILILSFSFSPINTSTHPRPTPPPHLLPLSPSRPTTSTHTPRPGLSPSRLLSLYLAATRNSSLQEYLIMGRHVVF